MKRGWIVNLLLAIGVAGLALYLVYRPEEKHALEHKLSNVASTAVARIRIEPSASPAIELAKRGNAWFLVHPFEARADPSQVERLLDLLNASSSEKLAATDLARFDLERPALTVILGEQRFAFGTVNPLTQDQYVQVGDAVYLLSAYYRSLVPQKPERLVTHALFLDNERPVAFHLHDFKVLQQDTKWTLSPSAAEQPSQDDFNRWVDSWRFASSLLTQPAGAKTARDTIAVELADGRSLKLGVLAKEPELILVRPDEKLQFHLSGELGKRLLAPPVVTALPAEAGTATSGVPPR